MEIDYKSLTKVTQQDLDEGVWDAEHKGLYSKNGKRFLQYIRPKELEWGQLDCFTFKSGVEVICEEAFSKYHSPLESLTIPESVVAIGDEAFQQVRLPHRSRITITKGLKYIGYKILGNFHGIIDLVIEEGITEINLGHILDCAPATTLYLPSTLESISEEGFGECDGTEHIHLAEGNKHFRVENGILYDYSKTALLRCPITKRGELRIPEGITTIGANALRLSGFPDAIDAEPEPKLSIILPQSLTKIKEGAFRHTWIDSLYIPENVSEIEEGAFENANHLIIKVSPNNQFFEVRNNLLIDKREMKVLFGMSNDVEIPNDIKSIANYAFRHLEPKSIVIPEGVTRIGLDNLNLWTLMYVSLPSTLQRITGASFWGLIGRTEEPLVIEVPFGMGEKFKKKLYYDDGNYVSSNIKETHPKKIGNVEEVQVVGEVSDRLLKSASMVGIWGDRDALVKTIWDNYKKNELEQVLNSNRKTKDDYENWEKGFITDSELENGTETISWVETYTFFPCLHDLPNENPELFFKEIEEPYNYNCSFLLEHYSERKLIFNHLEYGLGTWDMVVMWSVKDFAPFSKPALLLLEKFYDLQRFLRAQDHMYAQALQEVRNGKKTSHWIWYIFPQMEGLGKSELSQTYGIKGRGEAEAYIAHPILRERLVEICEAVLNNEKSVYEIFGNDAIKVRSCVLLFESVSDIPVFKQLKSKYRW